MGSPNQILLGSLLYGVGTTKGAVAAGAPVLEIQYPLAGATKNIGVTLIEIENTSAVLSQLALVRTTQIGVDTGAGTTAPVIIGSGAVAAQGRLLTGWATSVPLFAATVIKAFEVIATAGQEVVWTFPPSSPLIITPGNSVAVYNFGGGNSAALALNVEWVEFVPA